MGAKRISYNHQIGLVKKKKIDSQELLLKNYFINKFSGIEESQWTDPLTLLGSTADTISIEGFCLLNLIKEDDILKPVILASLNVGEEEYLYLGSTPKERVLNYLREV